MANTGKFKALFGAQDMTSGPILSCLIKFSIPLLIGNLAQLLYMTVDAVIVGRLVGDIALSAIGAAMPPSNFFLALFMGIGSGVTIMVSQYFGAKDYDNLGVSIGNSMTLVAIASIFITAVATPLTGPILRLVNTPPESFHMAESYMKILLLGAIGIGFYNVLSAILRGLGDSVFPLFVLIGTVILNTFLDILFIASFDMGVVGAAWATIIAQIVSSVVCLIKIMTMHDTVKIRLFMLRPVRRITKQIIRLGGPSAISMAIMFASTIFVQSLVNQMGYMVVTAITITQRLDAFAVIPSQTFQISAGTFTGQNIGAGLMDRVKAGTKTVILMSLIFSAVMVSSMLLFGKHMLGLFTSTESIVNMSITFIYILSPAYLAMSFSGSWMGMMRGAGDAVGPMWLSLLNNVIIRIPLSYLIAHMTRSETHPNGNPNSIFVALLAAMLLGCVITYIYYRAGKWRGKAITGQNSETVIDAA